MKTPIKILAVILSLAMVQLGCATPVPGEVVAISFTCPPDASPATVVGANLYELTPANTYVCLVTNTPVRTFTGTNYVTINVPAGTVMTFTFILADGSEGIVGNLVTNGITQGPNVAKPAKH